MSCTREGQRGPGAQDRAPLAPTPAPAAPRERRLPQRLLLAPSPRTPAGLQLRLGSGSREAEGRRCDSPPRSLPASVSPRVRRRQRLPSARLRLDRAAAAAPPSPASLAPL